MKPKNFRKETIFLVGALFSQFLFPLFTYGQSVFAYRHQEGDKWRLNVTVDEEVLINGVSVSSVEILNKIAVEILKGSGGPGVLWNHYDIAEKDKKTGVYKWSEEYEVRYGRNVNGQLDGIDEFSPIPSVRNVPVFPEKTLQPGDTWQAGGREIFNLEPTFHIPELLSIDFIVNYRYVGQESLDGRNLDIVDIQYEYDWKPNPLFPVDSRLMGADWFPLEVSGVFRQTLWWDNSLGRNYAVDGNFSYTYFMNDGDDYTFRGRSAGKAVYSDPLDRNALIKEIQELTDSHVVAQVIPEGVSVALDDIHFVPDQAVMLAGEENKLRGISEVLSRYPNREIMVVGHTARIPGSGDGQLLSEKRAETVASYLIESGTLRETQVMIRGKGNREPIGDDNTEEGRRKNRRVEIIILEN